MVMARTPPRSTHSWHFTHSSQPGTASRLASGIRSPHSMQLLSDTASGTVLLEMTAFIAASLARSSAG